MTGIGVAGIVTAALRIITKAVLPDYKSVPLTAAPLLK